MGNTAFYKWIWNQKENKRFLIIALLGTIVQFIIFKFCYPFADYFSDSYSYIYAAYANLNINIWPIGYSKFLRGFHAITSSDTALISFQFFFYILSALYFFFTILYFFNPKKNTKLILFIFLFFNPLTLYICNYVNSDPLFAALSVIWFTQLIWMIFSPSKYQVFTHAIILFLCFTVRNNAYYYPIVTVTGILLSKHNRWLKFTGIVLPLLLIGIFVYRTREAAYKLTGTRQFSLFTGWQLANNALYMRGYIKTEPSDFKTPESKLLDSLSESFYKTAPVGFNDFLPHYVANFFIREPKSPLKEYFKLKFNPKYADEVIRDWAIASVAYEDYGKTLIKNYPGAYIKHFILLNASNYFVPPLEKLEQYNLGSDWIDPIAKVWFNYKENKVTSASNDIQKNILMLIPSIFLFINACVGVAFLLLLFVKIIERKSNIYFVIVLFFILFLLNLVFSISVTINVLRYQFFPMIVGGAFSLILIESFEKLFATRSGSRIGKIFAHN